MSDFNELVAALSDAGFRTLAVESRGIGQSAGGGPFAAGTLHELGQDVLIVLRDAGVPEDTPVDVIGHDFGNRVARILATDHPERIRSLTLIAAGGQAPVEPAVGRALVISTLSFLPWIETWDFTMSIELIDLASTLKKAPRLLRCIGHPLLLQYCTPSAVRRKPL